MTFSVFAAYKNPEKATQIIRIGCCYRKFEPMDMTNKIQLLHPAGKHAVNMDKEKYGILRNAILYCLNTAPLTHTQLLEAVMEELNKNKIKFEGSTEWYMESVKLDLEARKLIQRFKEKSRLMFRISLQNEGSL